MKEMIKKLQEGIFERGKKQFWRAKEEWWKLARWKGWDGKEEEWNRGYNLNKCEKQEVR